MKKKIVFKNERALRLLAGEILNGWKSRGRSSYRILIEAKRKIRINDTADGLKPS